MEAAVLLAGFIKNFPDIIEGKELLLLICFKNPYAWIDSFQRYLRNMGDNHTLKQFDLKRETSIQDLIRHKFADSSGIAEHWSKTNKHYLDVAKRYPQKTMIIKVEEFYSIDGQLKILKNIERHFKLERLNQKFITQKKRVDINFSPGRKMNYKKYLQRDYLSSYITEDFEFINAQLDSSIMNALGYQKYYPNKK